MGDVGRLTSVQRAAPLLLYLLRLLRLSTSAVYVTASPAGLVSRLSLRDIYVLVAANRLANPNVYTSRVDVDAVCVDVAVECEILLLDGVCWS